MAFNECPKNNWIPQSAFHVLAILFRLLHSFAMSTVTSELAKLPRPENQIVNMSGQADVGYASRLAAYRLALVSQPLAWSHKSQRFFWYRKGKTGPILATACRIAQSPL